jgi:hypothetical protein
MGENPSTLRRDVEDARAQLGDTVDALAYKVSAPRRLADRGQASVRSRPGMIAVAGGCVAVVLAFAVRSARRW